jgi:hypothetical protein
VVNKLARWNSFHYHHDQFATPRRTVALPRHANVRNDRSCLVHPSSRSLGQCQTWSPRDDIHSRLRISISHTLNHINNRCPASISLSLSDPSQLKSLALRTRLAMGVAVACQGTTGCLWWTSNQVCSVKLLSTLRGEQLSMDTQVSSVKLFSTLRGEQLSKERHSQDKP